MKVLALIGSLLMLPLMVFAQVEEVPTIDFIKFLIDSMGGLKGASSLVIVGVVVQALIMFMKTPLFGSVFKNVNGALKLLIVSGLSIAGSVVALMSQGLSLMAALMHGTVLTALMVFVNELIKHFSEKK